VEIGEGVDAAVPGLFAGHADVVLSVARNGVITVVHGFAVGDEQDEFRLGYLSGARNRK